MDNATKLIKLIDERIALYFSKSNVLTQYPAVVTEVISNTKAKIKLLGYDTEFTLPVKNNLSLSVGDSVFIKCTVNDFNNSVIYEKFGD